MNNQMDLMCEELKDSKFPTIVWGGLMSAKIGNFFNNKKIPFAGFAVNQTFYNKNEVKDYPFYCIEEYVENNKCNIVVGFSKYNDSMLELLKKENIVKVYKVDFWGRFPVGCDDTVWTESFVKNNNSKLNKIRRWLCDEKSKVAFDDFCNQKQTCCFSKKYDETPQYFDSSIIKYTENEFFIDCGAYRGESSLEFIKQLRINGITEFKKILVLEPDSNNFIYAKDNLKKYKNIEIIPCGVGKYNAELCFSNNGTTSARFMDNGGISVSVKKIDDIAFNCDVTFIKMDIEGMELEALEGGSEIICRCKPKLAICVYHKADDIIRISEYIKELNPNYKLYLRNYNFTATETVLYAINKE